eukprot:3963226-Pleurochrysis_carterae.AAC.1
MSAPVRKRMLAGAWVLACACSCLRVRVICVYSAARAHAGVSATAFDAAICVLHLKFCQEGSLIEVYRTTVLKRFWTHVLAGQLCGNCYIHKQTAQQVRNTDVERRSGAVANSLLVSQSRM